jgi:hypothetical protein
VNFRNTVVIMTSNLGSLYLLDGVDASGEIMEDVRDRVMAELRGHFRPEFLNRVDETVLFKPLTLGEIEQIVDLQMEDLRKRLADRQITIELSGPAREVIARQGYDPVYGARPLRRYIQRVVETQIGRALLSDGPTVRRSGSTPTVRSSASRGATPVPGPVRTARASAVGPPRTPRRSARARRVEPLLRLLVAWMARPTAVATRNIDVSGHRQR